MDAPTNLFAELPADLPSELFQTLHSANGLRIERIVSHGHASPEGFWYDQDQHEWVVLLQGAARICFEDEIRSLKRGDFLHIPPHRRHRVEWTEPGVQTLWLAIHYRDSS